MHSMPCILCGYFLYQNGLPPQAAYSSHLSLSSPHAAVIDACFFSALEKAISNIKVPMDQKARSISEFREDLTNYTQDN